MHTSNGVRNRRVEKTETVYEASSSEPFLVVDPTGAVLIQPCTAKVDKASSS